MENIDFSQFFNSDNALYAAVILVGIIVRMLFIAFKKSFPVAQGISTAMQDNVTTNKTTIEAINRGTEAIKEQTGVMKEISVTMKTLATKEDVLSIKEYVMRNTISDPILNGTGSSRQVKNG